MTSQPQRPAFGTLLTSHMAVATYQGGRWSPSEIKPVAPIELSPGAHVLHYQVGQSVNFLAVVDGPERWTAPGGLAEAAPGELAAAFGGWHPSLLEMIDAVPQSDRWGLFALPSLREWSSGPIVLLGDAAHAMVTTQAAESCT